MAHAPIRGVGALAAGALVLAMAACGTQSSAPAIAEPAPVRALDIATGQQDDQVEMDVDGGADGVQVTFRKVIVEPGTATGRHCHHGQLVVVVEKGELTHYADTYLGGVHVYRAGDSIVEGARYVHEGVNDGPGNLEMMVSYITPAGEPLAVSDLAQCGQ